MPLLNRPNLIVGDSIKGKTLTGRTENNLSKNELCYPYVIETMWSNTDENNIIENALISSWQKTKDNRILLIYCTKNNENKYTLCARFFIPNITNQNALLKLDNNITILIEDFPYNETYGYNFVKLNNPNREIYLFRYGTSAYIIEIQNKTDIVLITQNELPIFTDDFFNLKATDDVEINGFHDEYNDDISFKFICSWVNNNATIQYGLNIKIVSYIISSNGELTSLDRAGRQGLTSIDSFIGTISAPIDMKAKVPQNIAFYFVLFKAKTDTNNNKFIFIPVSIQSNYKFNGLGNEIKFDLSLYSSDAVIEPDIRYNMYNNYLSISCLSYFNNKYYSSLFAFYISTSNISPTKTYAYQSLPSPINNILGVSTMFDNGLFTILSGNNTAYKFMIDFNLGERIYHNNIITHNLSLIYNVRVNHPVTIDNNCFFLINSKSDSSILTEYIGIQIPAKIINSENKDIVHITSNNIYLSTDNYNVGDNATIVHPTN